MGASKCDRCGKFARQLRRLRATNWQVMTGNVYYGCEKCSPELFEDASPTAPGSPLDEFEAADDINRRWE